MPGTRVTVGHGVAAVRSKASGGAIPAPQDADTHCRSWIADDGAINLQISFCAGRPKVGAKS